MEKKKLKLSITGSTKKTINSIEQAKTQSKNTVVIEKKSPRFGGNQSFSRSNQQNNRFNNKKFGTIKKQTFSKPDTPSSLSNFEKRKLAEQRATRRVKGEVSQKDFKNKTSSNTKTKRRELKLTISRALSEEDIGTRSRSIAALRRAKQKEKRELSV